ncbi:MAG: hypothetical protein WDW38_007899 [Sanguina aurantia]
MFKSGVSRTLSVLSKKDDAPASLREHEALLARLLEYQSNFSASDDSSTEGQLMVQLPRAVIVSAIDGIRQLMSDIGSRSRQELRDASTEESPISLVKPSAWANRERKYNADLASLRAQIDSKAEAAAAASAELEMMRSGAGVELLQQRLKEAERQAADSAREVHDLTLRCEELTATNLALTDSTSSGGMADQHARRSGTGYGKLGASPGLVRGPTGGVPPGPCQGGGPAPAGTDAAEAGSPGSSRRSSLTGAEAEQASYSSNVYIEHLSVSRGKHLFDRNASAAADAAAAAAAIAEQQAGELPPSRLRRDNRVLLAETAHVLVVSYTGWLRAWSPRPSIRRPIATSLLMVAVLLLGILGYRELPVSALPEIDAPSLVVTTQYPGASAATMASLVTTPLERNLGQISGLAMMTSDSSAGLSTIVLQFNMDRDIDIAAQDVQSALNQARGTLPSTLPYPPVYNRVNPADAPILTLSLTSTTLPLRDVNNYADSILAQKLAQVQGVGLVSIAGNVRPAVRVQVNPAQLANLGLTMEDVRNALTQANVNAPKGTLNGATQSYSIGTNDQLADANDYKNTIISYKNNAPVRLSDDVASVVDGVENDQLAAWANGKPAVLLDVRRQPGANIVQTVQSIRQILPQLQAVLPADVHLDVFADRTVTIRASVHDVELTLLITIGLVVAVIFVFLRRLWATIIPSVAVPLSLLGTFAVMSFTGMSLDNLSLMALAVATGFVVDDAIVMIENIVRYIEQGMDGKEAAEVGAKEIGFTVLSLTVSLVAVFLPLLLMPGVTGRLFHEFAWVLTIAVVISMLVSLTLTPMMCAYLLKADELPESDDAHERHAAAGTRTTWTRIVGGYERSLDWVLDHQRITVVVAGITVFITVILYIIIPKSLLPEQDTGMITAAVANALQKVDGVAGVAAFIGAGSVNPTLNQGQISIVLKERGDRANLETMVASLQSAAAQIPGVALYLKPVQDVTLDSQISATEYQYSMSDVDSALRKRSRAIGDGRRDRDLADQGTALKLTIDRDKASRLGVPVQTIDDTLYDSFGQRQISTIFTQLNQYYVVMEVAPIPDRSGAHRSPSIDSTALLNTLLAVKTCPATSKIYARRRST